MIRTLLMAALLFSAACAATYTLPPQDRAAIATRIASFERAFVNGDTTQIINVVPPRMIRAIARDSGVDEQLLRSEMAKLTREATAEVEVLSFGMSLENARFLTTPSGRPYGLIPTQTVVQVPGGGPRLQSDTTTLTLQDGGAWHLIRVEDSQQINLLREVYPEFQGVEFPEGTSKVIG